MHIRRFIKMNTICLFNIRYQFVYQKITILSGKQIIIIHTHKTKHRINIGIILSIAYLDFILHYFWPFENFFTPNYADKYALTQQKKMLISQHLFLNNAGDRNRTGTGGKSRRILSPVRLPVPPLRHLTWLRLTLPGGCPPSTISAKELNFCVRNGNRCILFAIITTLCHVI